MVGDGHLMSFFTRRRAERPEMLVEGMGLTR